MQRFRNILVYVDSRPESVQALAAAAALARGTGARLTVMDVVPNLPASAVRPAGASDLTDQAVAGRLFELEQLVTPYRADVSVTTAVSHGKVSLELIRQAQRDEHDLIIKTARGTERGRRAFFGTAAMHLIRKSSCPVWLVSSQQMRQRPRILAAINPQSGASSNSLALKVLDHARALARHLGAELHVLHAWHPEAAGLLRKHVSAEELKQYILDTERAARLAFEDVLDRATAATVDETHHLVRGQAERVIPQFARREKIDSIVMGSLGRTGIAGLLIGELAEEVLAQVRCGVFCVKPDGFVSPVTVDQPVVLVAQERQRRQAS
jgi:universal stress protein E